MVMGSRMQHGSAQPTAAHALQGKRNARVYPVMLYFRCIASSGHVRYMSYSDSMLNVILLP